jgi:hypothetical protein
MDMTKIEVESVVEPDFLRFTTIGKYAFGELFPFLEHVRSEADKSNRTRVLIDSRRLEGMMTEAERFQGGQKIAEVFGGKVKLALIMPPEGITKLGELTAVNRGARFLVTSCENEATNWLLTP